MKKYVLIWIIATFILTVLTLAIFGNLLPVGIVGHLIRAFIFVAYGYIIYKPVRSKFE